MAYDTDFDPSTTLNMVNAGMVAGSGSSITTTAITAGCVSGKFVTPLGVQTNAASPTVDANTGLAFPIVLPNYVLAIVFGQSAAGVLQMVAGTAIPTAPGAAAVPGTLLNDPQFPDLPNTFLPLAYTIVRVAPSANSFQPGTTAWAATGVVTTAFQNIAELPPRPQAS